MSSATILLDSHVWLWLINGESSITKRALNLINQAANNNSIFVSAISMWEVGMLASRERIILDKPCLDWLTEAINAPGINLSPLTPHIANESSQLPDGFHGDPADRIIVATARIEGHVLLTRDKKILEYGKKHHVKVFEA